MCSITHALIWAHRATAGIPQMWAIAMPRCRQAANAPCKAYQSWPCHIPEGIRVFAERVFASFRPAGGCGLLDSHRRPGTEKTPDRRSRWCLRTSPMTGRQTMVTKKEDAFVLKNLLALAAVETLGGAIALGMVFHLI
jgi:hypothetical protein